MSEVRVLHKNLPLLRVADEATLAELKLLVPLDRYVVAEVSPLELVLDPGKVRELTELLESRGMSALVRRGLPAGG